MDISGSIGIIMWVVALGTLIFDVVLGVVLAYHWTRFAMNTFMATLAMAMYGIVSALLLLSMFGAALTYQGI